MEKVTNYSVITKLQMHSKIKAKIRTHTKRKLPWLLITLAVLLCGISKEACRTPFTVETLRIEETFETFTGCGITAVGHARVDVVVTYTLVTRTTRDTRVAVEIHGASVTVGT